jgi:hypothetical protein
MKECCRCGNLKERSEFYKRLDAVDGLQRACKTCDRARKRESGTYWSEDHFRSAMAEQKAQCWICGVDMTDKRLTLNGPQADHCHASNVPRRILCRGCNTGLGLFEDNPLLLERARHYVAVYNPLDPLEEPLRPLENTLRSPTWKDDRRAEYLLHLRDSNDQPQ